jgi:hypothetical protein
MDKGMNLIKPYSNFLPSSNTRSNITIDRSGSVGYGKLNSTSGGPSSITHITDYRKTTNSRKMIMPINEYEDDSIVTINSSGFGQKSNLNTIIGIKNNNECNLTLNSYKTKNSSKEIIKRPKFNKSNHENSSLRSKSNKRMINDTFEKVYMQSPSKIIMRKHGGLNKSKQKILNNDSQGSLQYKNVNLRDNSMPPKRPKVREIISREPRHKTTVKKRSIPNFNTNLKQESSSITTSKDNV